MVQRLTYRRRHPYHNRSNRTRIVKTPGPSRACRCGRRRAARVQQLGGDGCTTPAPGVAAAAALVAGVLLQRARACDCAPACQDAHTAPHPPSAGGRLVYQYVKKTASHPTCAVSGARLHGVSVAGVESGGGGHRQRQRHCVHACTDMPLPPPTPQQL